ncbi:MutS-related protein [Nannocystis radixulma]|uniref:MutS-related protein n=1 Tax=Nannocystis radixulma TaxID=2995305 RepID=UPI00358DB65A
MQCLHSGSARATHDIVASCIGIADDLLSGRSYYRAELDAILRIVRGAEAGPCLVVLDEIFRGTNPLERTAAAVAVLQHLASRHLVLAATHDLLRGRHRGRRARLRLPPAPRPHRAPQRHRPLARTGFPDDIVQRAMQTSKMLPRPKPASNTGLREARSRP